MFLVRNVCEKDLNALIELSSLENLLGLPSDCKRLEEKIAISQQSFKSPHKERAKNQYLFILEDMEKAKAVGVAGIFGQHGTEKRPHFFFRISKEKKISQELDIEIKHNVLELDYQPQGYTEVGGLIIHPNYRGHPHKLGKLLSFSRFLYMAINAKPFTKIIHTELLPPLKKQGNPPLWDAIGKKFTNMDYHQADRLSRTNKQFILDLFPWNEKIYLDLLPPKAIESIGARCGLNHASQGHDGKNWFSVYQ